MVGMTDLYMDTIFAFYRNISLFSGFVCLFVCCFSLFFWGGGGGEVSHMHVFYNLVFALVQHN